MALTARKLALQSLLELDRKAQPIATVIEKHLRHASLSPADIALLNELVYGVLRWRGRLDWVIDQFVERPPEFAVRYILRLGVYQLLLMDKIPEHAAIYETVALSRPHQKAFVNAVLRNVQRKLPTLEYPTDPVAWYAVFYSYPTWLIERWFREYGPTWTAQFCEASNQQAPLDLRVNSLKSDRESVVRALESQGCQVEPLPYASEGIRVREGPPAFQLEALKRGWCLVQDEAAMLVTEVLDPQPDETVIDVCAAPGGKTTHIAQRMHNRGRIFAIDHSEARLTRLQENCRRLGVTNVRPCVSEAQQALPQLHGVADRVLVDVPCSGFGTLRRHPDIRWKRTEDQIHELARTQQAILEAAARYVRRGGVLVYSTCTTESEENEQVVDAFLSRHPEFSLDEGPHPPGLRAEDSFIRTFPHQHGMDGFFIARLRRRGSESR